MQRYGDEWDVDMDLKYIYVKKNMYPIPSLSWQLLGRTEKTQLW
jgi:hypothetical protein